VKGADMKLRDRIAETMKRRNKQRQREDNCQVELTPEFAELLNSFVDPPKEGESLEDFAARSVPVLEKLLTPSNEKTDQG
jgi:broad specificity phosphatase PhoE